MSLWLCNLSAVCICMVCTFGGRSLVVLLDTRQLLDVQKGGRKEAQQAMCPALRWKHE